MTDYLPLIIVGVVGVAIVFGYWLGQHDKANEGANDRKQVGIYAKRAADRGDTVFARDLREAVVREEERLHRRRLGEEQQSEHVRTQA